MSYWQCVLAALRKNRQHLFARSHMRCCQYFSQTARRRAPPLWPCLPKITKNISMMSPSAKSSHRVRHVVVGLSYGSQDGRNLLRDSYDNLSHNRDPYYGHLRTIPIYSMDRRYTITYMQMRYIMLSILKKYTKYTYKQCMHVYICIFEKCM